MDGRILKKNTVFYSKIYNALININECTLILALVLIILFLIFDVPFITSVDGFSYFATTKSLVEYHTFKLNDVYYLNTYGGGLVLNGQGEAYSIYPPGTAILWAPFYALVHFLTNFFDINFNDLAFFQSQGDTFFHTFSITIASNFYAILSCILCFKLANRILSPMKSLFVVFALFITTSFFYYSAIEPIFSQAADVFVVTLAIYVWCEYTKGKAKHAYWIFGALLGLATTVRYPDAILILPFFVYLLHQRKFRNALCTIMGFGMVIPIILIYNYQTTGSIAPPHSYSDIMLQYPINALNMLIHPLRGLFVYSPITALAIYGLYKKRNDESILMLVSFFLMVIFYGFSAQWHGGASFGSRLLLTLFPVYVIGFSYFFEGISSIKSTHIKKVVTILVFISIIHSLILFMAYMGGVSTTPNLKENEVQNVYKKLSSDKNLFLQAGMSVVQRTFPSTIFTYAKIPKIGSLWEGGGVYINSIDNFIYINTNTHYKVYSKIGSLVIWSNINGKQQTHFFDLKDHSYDKTIEYTSNNITNIQFIVDKKTIINTSIYREKTINESEYLKLDFSKSVSEIQMYYLELYFGTDFRTKIQNVSLEKRAENLYLLKINLQPIGEKYLHIETINGTVTQTPISIQFKPNDKSKTFQVRLRALESLSD